VRALLSADTDQALVRARTDGEKLVASMRLVFIAVLVFLIWLLSPESRDQPFILALSFGALLYGTGLFVLSFRVTKPWVSWASCALDVSLITAALATYVVEGNPIGALNNRLIFETYFFVIVNAALRYDWRLCAFTTSLALAEFLGLTGVVVSRWDLDGITSPRHGIFVLSAHLLRILLLAAVGASSLAVAKWARHLRLMVGTDHLTGLSQRRPFLERIDEELSRSGRDRGALSIAIFDVDEFKRFNDSYGHLAGDRALQLLAHRLRKAVRTTDLVARFGGEEFVVAFPRMDVERATRRVDELRQDLGTVPLPVHGETKHLTLSAGVGSWPADGQTFEEVLERVDRRLYQAKEGGRNRVIGPSRPLRAANEGG